MYRFLSPVLVALSLTAVGAARADVISGSSADGDTFTLYATITADTDGVSFIDAVAGTTYIDGVAGTVDAIINSSAPGVPGWSADGFFYFDNLLFSAPGNIFDSAGLAFTLQDGTEVNIFYNDSTPGSGLVYENNGYNATINSVSVSPTPEPSSLILLGTGILGAAGAVRRRYLRS